MMFSVITTFKNNLTVKEARYELFGLPVFVITWNIKAHRLQKRVSVFGIPISNKWKPTDAEIFNREPLSGERFRTSSVPSNNRVKQGNRIVISKRTPEKNTGVVYTCITGGYDELLQHNYQDLNWDYICFTDNQDLAKKQQIGHWQVRPLKFSELDPVRNARWHKMHPHILVPDYKCSIWLDASINVGSSLLFDRAQRCNIDRRIVSAPEHFCRTCIYEEALAVKAAGYDQAELVSQQIEILKKEAFPCNVGLNETGLLFRYHNDSQCKAMMDEWWMWIQDYSHRDQLSFNYIVWKFNYSQINFLDKPGLRDKPEDFEFVYAPSHNGRVRTT
jgi:Protein of unknown function (DUF616)